MEKNTFRLKSGLAEMLKGGVIMDVTTPEQAVIAQEAGACAVMALEKVPADIRRAGGVGAHGRSGRGEEHHGRGEHSRHGQGPHRTHRRSAHSGAARRGLHRRERSAHARGREFSSEQARIQDALRVRRAQSGRSAAAHRRGRGHDTAPRANPAPATWWKPCGTCAWSRAS